MTTETDRHGIGGNNPPTIEEELAERFSDLEDEVLALVLKARKVQPLEIKTDEDVVTVGAIVREAQLLEKKVEEAREAEKRPHLQAGRDVDAFFHRWVRTHRETDKIGRVTKIGLVLGQRITAFQRAKVAASRAADEEAERLRRVREEAARKRAEEAEERGDAAGAAEAMATADAFAELRQRQAAEPAPSGADQVRVRGEGVTVSSRATWTHEVEDIAKIDLNALRPHLTDAAIRSAIAAYVAAGGRALDGVRIFQDSRAIVR